MQRKTLIFSLVLVSLGIGCKPKTSTKETVEVVALSYKSATTSTGIGYGYGSNGGATVVTTSTTPSEHDVIVDCPVHGRVIIDSKHLFNTVKPGDKIEVEYNTFWYGREHDAE